MRAGEERTPLEIQIKRIVKSTQCRLDLGSRGYTIAFLLSILMARRVKTLAETVTYETKLLILQYTEPNFQTLKDVEIKMTYSIFLHCYLSLMKMKEGMQFRVAMRRSSRVRFTRK